MPLKISELEKITGVPQSTIRYYVKEGLLPKPEKINKSMAYYDESCIDRIALVRNLQENKYYPLSVIKNILKSIDKGANLNGLLTLEDAIFGSKLGGAHTFFSREEFLKAAEIDSNLLNTMEEMGLLIPFNRGSKRPYNEEDLTFARLISQGCLELGVDIRDMGFYVEMGKQIVEEEIQLRKKLVKGKSTTENIKITTILSERSDEMRSYIMRRLFQNRVKKMIENQGKQ
ncbi:MAG: MerR family transcriptional regulator [Deltaproteobacteria bacterium]|nr:MerR family transcriptional regulator [Candidatus Zymogenaceae bacterium]